MLGTPRERKRRHSNWTIPAHYICQDHNYMGHFEIACWTGGLFCQNALWQCLGGFKIWSETGSKFKPQNSYINNTVSTLEWPTSNIHEVPVSSGKLCLVGSNLHWHYSPGSGCSKVSLLYSLFLSRHASLLPTALRDDTKNGCEADYSCQKPDSW